MEKPAFIKRSPLVVGNDYAQLLANNQKDIIRHQLGDEFEKVNNQIRQRPVDELDKVNADEILQRPVEEFQMPS